MLSDVTGLHFVIKPITELTGDPGSFDVTYHTIDYNGRVNIMSEHSGGTQSIIDESFSLFHKSGSSYSSDIGADYKVAIPENRDGIYDYFTDRYPNYSIEIYDSPEQCIDALTHGDVDLTFLNDYVANNIIVNKDIDDIVAIPTKTVDFGIGLQFYGDNKEVLASIINKGIALIDEDEVQNSIISYALNTTPELSFGYLFKHNSVLVVCVFASALILIVIMAVVLSYAFAMRKSRSQIQQANASKSSFFSRMSHDMRTPMNGILGIAELSKSENDPIILKKNIGKIEESGEYLLGLINDTLDIQRIESGRMQLEVKPVNTKAFVNNIIDMITPNAKNKGIRFWVTTNNVDLDRYFLIDPLRLKQIFVNLLSNAIKFTPEGGEVEVTINCLGNDENIYHEIIKIRDTGVGMSEKFINESLYKPFSQENNAMTMNYAGSGLGLSIVKSLVTLMRGTIDVQSELGKGTVFTINLDIEKVDNAEKEELDVQNQKLISRSILNGKKILLCEDHPVNAEITIKMLENTGCVIDWENDGQKGVKRFDQSEECYYDVVLMDVRMPVMNGLEAARTIRRLSRQDALSVPIIAMTANAYDEDVREAKEAGMTAHIAKPVKIDVLYDTIAKYINNRKDTQTHE